MAFNFHKYLIISLIILLSMLQYALWFGDKNLFDWYRLQQITEQTYLEGAQIKQQNNQLIVEINGLKNGDEPLETIARSRFGLIKKNETFFQVIP